MPPSARRKSTCFGWLLQHDVLRLQVFDRVLHVRVAEEQPAALLRARGRRYAIATRRLVVGRVAIAVGGQHEGYGVDYRIQRSGVDPAVTAVGDGHRRQLRDLRFRDIERRHFAQQRARLRVLAGLREPFLADGSDASIVDQAVAGAHQATRSQRRMRQLGSQTARAQYEPAWPGRRFAEWPEVMVACERIGDERWKGSAPRRHDSRRPAPAGRAIRSSE